MDPSPFAYASNKAYAPNPLLTVEHIGSLGIPLSDRHAKALISKYGETPGVTSTQSGSTKSFKLSPSQFSIRSPDWPTFMDELTSVCYQELKPKCGRQHVVAELRNLFWCEDGASVRAPQDQEICAKSGVFGALAVYLPSNGQVGNVTFKYEGDEYFFDSSRNLAHRTRFATWYSDVLQESLEVCDGYRPGLTYNLVRIDHLSS